MELSQYAELFLSESREHVSAINHLLLTLENDPASRQAVEGLFRAVHTIKGMSATMGYRDVADLAHEMENLMDGVRAGRVTPDAELVDLLFSACDALEGCIEVAVDEADTGADHGPLLASLRAFAGGGDPHAPAVQSEPEAAIPAEEAEAEAGTLRVRVAVSSASGMRGVRAFLAVKQARALGEVTRLEPPEEALQEEGFAGVVRFFLRTDRDLDAVEAAIRSAGEIDAVEIGGGAAEAMAALGADAAAEGGADAAGGAGRARNIRVDLRRLDALVNGVGELVIVRDRMRNLAQRAEPELTDSVDQASRLISELQDEIMRARMAPVWQVFDRFPRLVRDAARTLGKKVDFVIEGKEIELDRSMLDEIGDPLVHLLRNSLDHGIEPPPSAARPASRRRGRCASPPPASARGSSSAWRTTGAASTASGCWHAPSRRGWWGRRRRRGSRTTRCTACSPAPASPPPRR
jgi:two-component system, chemotaxis family, sensor kinase CheA